MASTSRRFSIGHWTFAAAVSNAMMSRASAAASRPPPRGRRRGLERHDVARLGRSVARAAEGEQLRDVGNVLAAQLLELRIVLEVIVAIGKAEGRLADKDAIAVGVLEVGRQLHVEQRGESRLPEQV